MKHEHDDQIENMLDAEHHQTSEELANDPVAQIREALFYLEESIDAVWNLGYADTENFINKAEDHLNKAINMLLEDKKKNKKEEKT